MDSNRDPLWMSISTKIFKNDLHVAALKELQQISDSNANMETQHLPKQVFRFRGATFSQFFSICYKTCKIASTCTPNDTKIILNWCWDLPKAMKTKTHKMPSHKSLQIRFWSKYRRKKCLSKRLGPN